MKLYYKAGACSLADHIGLREAGIEPELVAADLKARTTEDGGTIDQVNPKGYVPALVLDNGELLTENAAILSYLAEKNASLLPEGELGRTRLIEMLAFIGSELHKSYGPFFAGQGDEAKNAARAKLDKRHAYLAEALKGPFIFGEKVSAADPYLYVVLRWADAVGISVPEKLKAFKAEMEKRPAVQKALAVEGLA
ncbi:MAG: glutathione S-transferase C-terminal domain-containing protein [Methylobacterium mesophilicum]|nr:glutathione S-transferase C-terminal domain-containing protein [Methylobacterium mesophilicum]